jgi:hypothetical protein
MPLTSGLVIAALLAAYLELFDYADAACRASRGHGLMDSATDDGCCVHCEIATWTT